MSTKLQWDNSEHVPSWLVNQTDQVSHGLNLVLKLKNPNQMPLVLWDIAVNRRKIQQALEDLSFVHYARFVPSWDAKTLMVITEFDGPLDPYVLDFVIALGDVFDVLLSYVDEQTYIDGLPPFPVREHPARFLAWVREWNRVPFFHSPKTKFPKDFDYPLYSAYPKKTVTDILRRRENSSRPYLDGAAVEVDPAEVQGNILKGYHVACASYLFFQVVDVKLARKWLSIDLTDSRNKWGGVATAELWDSKNPPQVMTQVAFTYAALVELLGSNYKDLLEKFPGAFKEGAKDRAEKNFDRNCSAPKNWIFGGGAQSEHIVVFLYAKSDTANYQEAIRLLAKDQPGLKWLRTQQGESSGGYEPFGFRDGVSEPRISGQCPSKSAGIQAASSLGEFLLHPDYASVYGGSSLGEMPKDLAIYGTFGVLRLMEQNVSLLEKTLESESKRLGLTAGVLAEKLMGRKKDGTPLSLDIEKRPFTSQSNDFDYAPTWEYPNSEDDYDGARCPAGAHIRRANPRSALVAGARNARRLLRRGMNSKWQEGGVEKVGLMGLFLGANIEQQFEFIQREWLQGDLAASGIRGTSCPISGIRGSETEFRFETIGDDGSRRSFVARIPPLVTTRGCLYLFFPGIKALKRLDALASNAVIERPATFRSKTLKHDGARSIEDAHKYAIELDSAIEAQVSKLMQEEGGASKAELLKGGLAGFVKSLIDEKLEAEKIGQIIRQFLPLPRIVSSTPNDLAKFNISDPAFLAAPHEELEKLRRSGKKIVWVEQQSAFWVINYDGCEELLRSNVKFVQTQPPSNPVFQGVVTLDEPRHVVVRAALDAAFGAALAGWKEKVPDITNEAINGLSQRLHQMQFDFMRSYAQPVARASIWALVGIKNRDEQRALDALAHTAMMHYGRKVGADAADGLALADAGLRLSTHLALHLGDAFLDSITGGEKYRGTLFGELAKRMSPVFSIKDRPLKFLETLATLVQTVLASQSPHLLLSSATLHLLQKDDTGSTPWCKLAATADDINKFDDALANALEEARRFEPPLALIERYANGVQEICGQKLPAGSAVFAMIGSGNRDESKFGTDSNKFVYDRTNAKSHLSLGSGIHACAGRKVQGIVVHEALSAMIRAMPDLRLSYPLAVPAWEPTVYFRALQSLPVERCSI